MEIVLAYNAEWRGFANYYALADDVKHKLNKAGYFALFSCVKTIAVKHRTSARKVFARLHRYTHRCSYVGQAPFTQGIVW
ncbi:group II intron reverse transcriptase/maturase [Novosphingobium sp. Rr 2-17]|uniref:group II intron reverse transcriptase/maturase n=1 Tax=Novosphingobium sp. Rr 2-17 TaxID=555793 RepID=UPI001ED93749|nr:group II intron reverse transcriptase/maturase [Novosphingobium sp. Rr 2-17]